MAIPSFDGIPGIFGLWHEFLPATRPPRLQIDNYPGLNGRTLLWLGTEGGQTVCRCLLYGNTEAELAAVENIWMGYHESAFVANLVDSLGRTWANTYVSGYEPQEGSKPCDLGLSRVVQITFDHLT